MNNNNPFGIVIPTDEDLMTAQPSGTGKREILEAGIYYATIASMEFKTSKSNLPMIVVDFNIIDDNSQKAISIKDYWMLASNNDYKPSIFSKLAGLFICWGVPQELRGVKYFSWVPQGNEDPASRLMQCILNYSKVAKINTSYISKLMVKLSIDKIANTYKDQNGNDKEGFNNSIKAFAPLDNVDNNQQQVSSNTTTTDNVEGNKSNNPFDDYI